MNKVFNKLIGLVIIIPGIYLAIVWPHIADAIPIHFNIEGQPDKMGSKNDLLLLVIILSVFSLLLFLLLKNIYKLDPKKNAAANKDRLIKIGFAVAVFIMCINCFFIYNAKAGTNSFKVGILLSVVGLFFAILGNYMPNLKPNYFAGFRLPWTLENPENWKKTHALAGKLWVGGGMFLAIICLFIPSVIAIIVFFTVLIIITIIPCYYSYKMFRKKKTVNS